MTNNFTRPAYTINATGYVGKIDDCPTCNAIGFCDVFWSTRVRYANAVIKDKPSLNDLASVNTYEHVLIHEWMHNDDVIGLSSHSKPPTNQSTDLTQLTLCSCRR
jgi:hypothetical protein